MPIRNLVHRSREVLQRVESGERVEITRRGRVVVVLTAPDPDEVAMDELVATNQVRPGWRERRARLRQTLRDLPSRTASPGPSMSTALVTYDHRLARHATAAGLRAVGPAPPEDEQEVDVPAARESR